MKTCGEGVEPWCKRCVNWSLSLYSQSFCLYRLRFLIQRDTQCCLLLSLCDVTIPLVQTHKMPWSHGGTSLSVWIQCWNITQLVSGVGELNIEGFFFLNRLHGDWCDHVHFFLSSAYQAALALKQDPANDCPDSQRTVRIVVQKRGLNEATLGTEYRDRKIYVQNSESRHAGAMTQINYIFILV